MTQKNHNFIKLYNLINDYLLEHISFSSFSNTISNYLFEIEDKKIFDLEFVKYVKNLIYLIDSYYDYNITLEDFKRNLKGIHNQLSTDIEKRGTVFP
jgi:ADP-glucose pyrophosphorylase